MSGRRRCVVIGAGLLGLATAWSLSRRGWRVTVVETSPAVGHARAGSKGSARIFRLGYPDPRYVAMAQSALRMWRDLEGQSGRTLLTETGQVTLGGAGALEAIASALAGAGLRAHTLSAGEAARRFPSIAFGGPALFEPHSGVLHADACLEALRVTGGFELRTGLGVTALDDGGGSGLVVRAGAEWMHADVAVVCAGPRSLGLLGLRPHVAAPPSFPQVAYVAPKDPASRSRPPVFIEWSDDMIYGLPVPERTGSGPSLVKVSHHTPGEAVDGFDPTDPSPLPDDDARVRLLCDAVDRLLPSFDPRPVATERCVYDNSADTDFILDRVGRVVLGCGTSGHGFKFGPYLGELLADLAEDIPPAFVQQRFGLARPLTGGGPVQAGPAGTDRPSLG